MGQYIAGPDGAAADIGLDQLAAHIRDNCDSIAQSLEDTVADIEILVLPESPRRAQRVLHKLQGALNGVRRLTQSDHTDRTAVASLARTLSDIFRDLDALRRGVPEDA